MRRVDRRGDRAAGRAGRGRPLGPGENRSAPERRRGQIVRPDAEQVRARGDRHRVRGRRSASRSSSQREAAGRSRARVRRARAGPAPASTCSGVSTIGSRITTSSRSRPQQRIARSWLSNASGCASSSSRPRSRTSTAETAATCRRRSRAPARSRGAHPARPRIGLSASVCSCSEGQSEASRNASSVRSRPIPSAPCAERDVELGTAGDVGEHRDRPAVGRDRRLDSAPPARARPPADR